MSRINLHRTIRTVSIPAYAHFAATELFESRALRSLSPEDVVVTSGLCRTVEEAEARLDALLTVALEPAAAGAEWSYAGITQAPKGQANEKEMAAAAARLSEGAPRDGGMCQAAITAALAAGIHSVEWAIASRYLVAGWV